MTPTESSEPIHAAHAAVRSAFVVRRTGRDAILVRGGDRVSWLNGLLTCDVAKRRPDEALYGLLLEKKGRIRADLEVVPEVEGDALVLAVPHAVRDETFAALDHHLIMEDVELSTPELAFYAAFGPRSAELVRTGDAPFVGKIDLLGVGGGVIFGVPNERAAAFEDALRAKLGELGGAFGDDEAYAALCIEQGLPRFGVEFDTTMLPQEASLEKRAVSFDKGCYLGQEVVYMLEHRGHPKRKLCAIELEGNDVPANGASVATADGEAIGDVRNATRGPLRGRVRALAMIKWSNAKPGTELRVDGRAAHVVSVGDVVPISAPAT